MNTYIGCPGYDLLPESPSRRPLQALKTEEPDDVVWENFLAQIVYRLSRGEIEDLRLEAKNTK